MLIDHQSRISGDIPGDLLFPLLVDKAPKASDVNIVAIRHGVLHYAEKCFDRGCNISFIHSGLFRYFVDYICFGHGAIFRSKKNSGGQI